MRNRHSSTLAFLDFLFNLLLAFVCLVILLLMQVKASESASKAPENKNEFIVQAIWDSGTDDDVDLWSLDPVGNVIGFKHREAPGMFLQRDDTGRTNKFTFGPDGEKIEELPNFEIVNITKVTAGRYVFNLHLYRPDLNLTLKDPESVITITVRVIKINPFQELPPVVVKLHRSQVGLETTAIGVTIDNKGNVESTDTLPTMFVLQAVHDSIAGQGPNH